MVLKIEYKCTNCGRTVYWLYNENEGRLAEGIRGCRGKDCMTVHDLRVTEIDDETENELRDELAEMMDAE